jgi:glutamine phosphoribosylpyrophosphate amidotransferase
VETVREEPLQLNNQPIRAGAVIGTHNGTILNADRLFKKYRLPRVGEVDSEFLFRLADKKECIEDFTVCARNVRGGMSAVFTRTSAPDTVLVIKGNKPLSLWYHKGFRAVFYSSEEWPLLRVIGMSRSVVPLEIDPYTLSVFNIADLMNFRQYDLYFKGKMRSYSSWGYDIFSSMEL